MQSKLFALFLVTFALLAHSEPHGTTTDDDFKNIFKTNNIVPGDGVNFPNQGDSVTVHYVGTYQGSQFDSSRDRGKPFSFSLGKSKVIKCWDMAVARMSLGEKTYFVCPSELAYGAKGAGKKIPPNANIAFEVELLDYSGTKVKPKDVKELASNVNLSNNSEIIETAATKPSQAPAEMTLSKKYWFVPFVVVWAIVAGLVYYFVSTRNTTRFHRGIPKPVEEDEEDEDDA